MDKVRIKAEIVNKMLEYPDMDKNLAVTLGCDGRTAKKYMERNSIILTCYSVMQLIKITLRIPEHLQLEDEYPAPIKAK